MNIISGIIVFLLIWWTVLFTTLPLGVRQNEGDVHTGIKAAPDTPDMRKKLILTTGISLVIWGIVAIVINSEAISFRNLAKEM